MLLCVFSINIALSVVCSIIIRVYYRCLHAQAMQAANSSGIFPFFGDRINSSSSRRPCVIGRHSRPLTVKVENFEEYITERHRDSNMLFAADFKVCFMILFSFAVCAYCNDDI
jgi:hypothetical protein